MGKIKDALQGKSYIPSKEKESDGKVELVILDCRNSGVYIKAVAAVKAKDGWRLLGDSPSTGIMLEILPDDLPKETIVTEYGDFEVIKLPIKVRAKPVTPVRFKDVEIVGDISLDELDEIIGRFDEVMTVRAVVENGVAKYYDEERRKNVVVFPSRSTEGGKMLEMFNGREVILIGMQASNVEMRDVVRVKMKWTLPIPIEEPMNEPEWPETNSAEAEAEAKSNKGIAEEEKKIEEAKKEEKKEERKEMNPDELPDEVSLT